MHRSSHSRHSAGSRSSSSHSNSSAFSANANPHEDWTKISDLAERRRIQNRIAQRNYRKKLKRRLEDLERRAGSSSASPERSQEPEEQIKPTPTTTRTRKHRASKSISDTDGRNSTDLDFDSYHGQEDRGTMFSHQCTRQLSASPPPVFSYPSYPHLEYDGYGTPPPMYHNPVTGSYGEVTIPREYEYGEATMPTVPGVAAAAAVAAGVKRVHYYADDYEEIMSPFSMSYASMAGIDLCPTPQPLPESSLPVHHPASLLV